MQYEIEVALATYVALSVQILLSIRHYYSKWFTGMSKMRICVNSFRDGSGMYVKLICNKLVM